MNSPKELAMKTQQFNMTYKDVQSFVFVIGWIENKTYSCEYEDQKAWNEFIFIFVIIT
jgi:hypothetical protein